MNIELFSLQEGKQSTIEAVSTFSQCRLPTSRGGFPHVYLEVVFLPKPINVKPHRNLRWLRGEESLAFVGQQDLHCGVLLVPLEGKRACVCVCLFVRIYPCVCMHTQQGNPTDLLPHFPALAPHHYGNITGTAFELLLYFLRKR